MRRDRKVVLVGDDWYTSFIRTSAIAGGPSG
jgi:hypothetical protein